MRAPPEAAKRTKGVFLSSAVSAPFRNASPACMPSEPPMNSKSWTAITVGEPSTRPNPTLKASRIPVFARASLMRSAYLFSSRKRSGSAAASGSATSSQVPPSNISFSRCVEFTRR